MLRLAFPRSIIALTLALAVAQACHDPSVPSPPTPTRTYDLQGHRGARGLRPENTLPAMELALDLEVDTLELDLHLTADDQLVVWHDPVIDPAKCHLDPSADPGPSIDSREAPVRIRSLTLAELARYRCDLNPDPSRFPEQAPVPGLITGSAYEIATLDAVFDLARAYADDPRKPASSRAKAAKVRFNIETKRSPEDPSAIGDGFDGKAPGVFERLLVERVTSRGLDARVIIQSFDPRSLSAVQQLAPSLAVCALTRDVPDLPRLAARGIAVWSPRHDLLDPALVSRAQALGLRVVPWTVNDPATMKHLLDLGVDGLITDRPDLAPPRPTRPAAEKSG